MQKALPFTGLEKLLERDLLGSQGSTPNPQLLLGRGAHTPVEVKGVRGFPDMLKPEEVGEGVKQCPLGRPPIQGHCSGDGGLLAERLWKLQGLSRCLGAGCELAWHKILQLHQSLIVQQAWHSHFTEEKKLRLRKVNHPGPHSQ